MNVAFQCKRWDNATISRKEIDAFRGAIQGEYGELCVRGSSLALGYYNNSEKTASSFIQNPLNRDYPERVYVTGDLGRYDQQGDLFFCGRTERSVFGC